MSKVMVITCDVCGKNISLEQPQIMTSGTNVVTKVADEGSVAATEAVGVDTAPDAVAVALTYESNLDVCKACCKLIMK